MIVKRIADLGIHQRNFITAIKGHIEDSFIDEDLCSYTFEQQLYLYLKKEGYDRVYFYTRAQGYNWYSYDEKSIATLFSEESSTERQEKMPMGRLKRAEKPKDCKKVKSNENMNGRKYFFANFEDSTITKTVHDVMHNSKYKSVIYFSTSTFKFDNYQGFIDGIAQINREVAAAKSENKILLQYINDGVFRSVFFTEKFKSQENVFTVGLPDRKECENWLEAIRINKLVDSASVFSFPYNTLVDQIYSQHQKINNLNMELTSNKAGFIESFKIEAFSEELLKRSLSKIHGQQDNMSVIVKKVVTWVNRPDEAKKPLVFMFAGTSGTGKTYTAETITDCLKSYGYVFLKLPMNEYKNSDDKNKLLGSPTGYTGSDDDAPIFSARKKSEKMVILFDEIEKAHESIFEIIMTLMEKGELTNGKGEIFDFKQSIIIFTSNIAMNELMNRKKELMDSGLLIDSFEFQNSVKEILKKNGIKNEICGRLNSVFVYNTLGNKETIQIAIEEIRKLGAIYDLKINDIPGMLLKQIVSKVAENNEGARPIITIVGDLLENVFSENYQKTKGATPKSDKDPAQRIVDITCNLEIVDSRTNHLLSANEIFNQYKDIAKTKKTTTFDSKQLLESLKRIKGQQDNVNLIVKTIVTWLRKANKKKPLVFMLAGTSGTGKTFTVETICEALKGYRLVKLNMNEYHSDGDVWKLLGSSSGYVGSDKEPPIFAARKQTEKLIILFDEIEKANESLFTTIMTLMEKGEMANGHGEMFEFKQTIIFFTSNLAMTELTEMKKSLIEKDVDISSNEFQDKTKNILKTANLKNEISGRIDWLLVYNPLDASTVAQIAFEKIRSLGKEYEININRVPCSFLKVIGEQCRDNNEGARPINRIVTNKLESILQDAYESELYDSDTFYDLNEEMHLVLSSEKELITIDKIINISK